MAEKDIAEELEDRLDGGTPDDAPVEEPDLEDDDNDGDADKPEDEEPGPDDAEPEDEPEPIQTRRSTARDRIQTLQRERDEARQREQQAQRERDEARNARQREDTDAEARREQEVLAGLDEQGKTQYLLAKELKKTQTGQARLEQEIADSRDQADFAAKAARDTRRARLMDEVERIYQQNRSPGLKRDAVYYLLLGKKLEEGTLNAGTKQRAAAGKRVAAQRTTGGRPRSDAAPRQRGRGDLAARMEADDPAI